MSRPELSVVIVTLDPNPYVLSWALDSIEHQKLDRRRFEVLIVDNGSRRKVGDLAAVQDRPFTVRVVEEPETGATPARCRGIREAGADWLVFLDDDNYLDPDYLGNALRVIESEPQVGAFGGVARFLCDAPQPAWAKPLLPYLGIRDYGAEPITSTENKWGEWEPIGAGMVFRKDVGLEFCRLVGSNPLARRLGRTKTSFISGEDSLIARCAYGLGYSCSYQPSLKLTHFIRCTRLNVKTLAKTIEGVARAWVICETVLGTTKFADISSFKMVPELMARARHRIRLRGLKAGLIETSWDIGYMREVRACNRTAAE